MYVACKWTGGRGYTYIHCLTATRDIEQARAERSTYPGKRFSQSSWESNLEPSSYLLC